MRANVKVVHGVGARLGIFALLFCFCGGNSQMVPAGQNNNPNNNNNNNNNNTPPAVATPVGTQMGAVASKTVGPAGGTVMSEDGALSLIIPPGALSANTNIEVQAVVNHAWGGRGAAYQLLPHGQTFASPVTLQFKYTDEDVTGTAAEALGVAYQDEEAKWRWLRNPSLDTSAKTVSVRTSHFSHWSMVAGWQIRPAQAMVSRGGSVALEVVECLGQDVPGAPGEDTLLTLMNECRSSDPDLPPLLGSWAVNGRRGGGADVGTVAPTAGPSNTYVAPSTGAGARTFAVSAEMLQQRGRMLLVSNITVTDSTDWVGEVRFMRTGMKTEEEPPLTGCGPLHTSCERSIVRTHAIQSSGTIRYVGDAAAGPSGAVLSAVSVSAEASETQTLTHSFRGTRNSGCVETKRIDGKTMVSGSISGLPSPTAPPIMANVLISGSGYMLTLSPVVWDMRGTEEEHVRIVNCPPPPSMSDSNMQRMVAAIVGFPLIHGQIDPNDPKRLQGSMMLKEMDGNVEVEVTLSWNFVRP